MKAVGVEEGTALAAEYQMAYTETSAKENINVDECFLALCKASKNRLQSTDYLGSEAKPSSFPLSARKERKSACYS